MEPAPHRRRPRSRPPGPAEPPGPAADRGHPVEPADEPPARGRNPFGLILVLGAVAIVAVIVVAAATGTVDDLPWGAIVGVAVVMAFAYAAARRRRIPPDDDA
jgi:hypothetical protein